MEARKSRGESSMMDETITKRRRVSLESESDSESELCYTISEKSESNPESESDSEPESDSELELESDSEKVELCLLDEVTRQRAKKIIRMGVQKSFYQFITSPEAKDFLEAACILIPSTSMMPAQRQVLKSFVLGYGAYRHRYLASVRSCNREQSSAAEFDEGEAAGGDVVARKIDSIWDRLKSHFCKWA